jgi:hypothetical protein
MTNYLFILVDREDASQSTTSHFKTNLEPKLAFRFAFIEHIGEDEQAEQYYEDVVKENVVVKEDMITYDEEFITYLLIPLK